MVPTDMRGQRTLAQALLGLGCADSMPLFALIPSLVLNLFPNAFNIFFYLPLKGVCLFLLLKDRESCLTNLQNTHSKQDKSEL